MQKWHHPVLLALLCLSPALALENTTCKTCHPKIYVEYQRSIHAQSSIYKDLLHKALWDRHPNKQKENYSCAKCHTPSDHDLLSGKHALTDNAIQQTEPISCQACHQIESIETHAKANTNIFTDKKKYFFSANSKKKGEKIIFKEEKRFFGLFSHTSGSPYHDIDYSNKGYYTGRVCMGCHAHKQNESGFAICDLEVKQTESKETCISCHMPQTQGPLANQKQTATHAFHGSSVHNGTPTHLSRTIDLNLTQATKGFKISIKNHATHTLFVHPLRLGELRVTIERGDREITLKAKTFRRVIGKAGKPTMPWLADTVLLDSTIKAGETRAVPFDTPLQQGDILRLVFGYHIADPKMAAKLGIKDTAVTEFVHLTEKRITIGESQ